MRPDVWGPGAWLLLHSITLDYPEKPTNQDKQNMINFINAFAQVIPCEKCRNNFKKHLLTLPLTDKVLETREHLVNWLIDIHNLVNESRGVKKLTYKEALESLLKKYQSNETCSLQPTHHVKVEGEHIEHMTTNNKSNYMYLLLVLILILIIVFIYFYSNWSS
ncbi:MAG: disulfide thiol oxidoreductase, Erv1 / Alr family [Barrevirus sp.]|uniref:Sulfhydryl oxidase n=1 Tax=Barrevirus sp. TaxID=2487763 RepID=A0A3G4ZSE5_9VIRU|nr:MAG: disulfide thiol oxidoreductase, Erv1 / Alr family [Barrevirus sp.]